ncbi:MAG: SDR family NAD(P)-dependent oxidoreductase [Alphaproteobacteria bacterium]
MSLQDKTVLVTGASRGIGRAIAIAAAAAGAKVALTARSMDALKETAATIVSSGGTAHTIVGDAADAKSIEKAVAATAKKFGGLDVLINNAGYVKVQKFLDSGPEDWKAQIDTCLYGAIHCCRAAAPHMVKQNGGRIVSLIGDSSRIGEANISMAAATRAGTMALGKSLAKELGRNGVTVNTVSLGLVQTSHSDAEFLAKNMDKIVRNYPLRRIGNPDDVAPMVAFLASDQAAWITGQTISVNGGFAMV